MRPFAVMMGLALPLLAACGDEFVLATPPTTTGTGGGSPSGSSATTGSSSATSSTTSSSTASSSGAGGASSSTGGPIPKMCANTFSDEFSGTELSQAWGSWTYPGANLFVVLEGGAAEIQYPANDDSYPSAGVYTEQQFDLRGCVLSVEHLEAPAPGMQGGMWWGASTNGGNDTLTVGTWNGGFYFHVRENDVIVMQEDLDFDPVAHRHWRIVEDGLGHLSFDVSADGATWNTLRTTPTPAFVSAVALDFGGEIDAPHVEPGATRLDNMRLGPAR